MAVCEQHEGVWTVFGSWPWCRPGIALGLVPPVETGAVILAQALPGSAVPPAHHQLQFHLTLQSKQSHGAVWGRQGGQPEYTDGAIRTELCQKVVSYLSY